ncbi:hypothetical protein M409DRAFT_23538 [Zasmidium cellare ATCC 36951]|uniref:Uncharacterized protein n=1 Tax=Zasmidium cellare ATCC 36951 TaxID=1080233 RepID=A0A6A6CLN4_ZASCE|nr:uncharacterized protein M409DRAFT_23538 [Zasmidium cellare ATCC 36951]KAF2166346.1 hypothetical protein M409DRAFT_23538 [Zasmidium cellare ATCC 36951]
MPLSQKQMEYLALAWQCFETEPKIDYAKFATVANLASVNSARELMRVTKKKLKEEYGALDNGTATSPIKKSTSTPRSTPGAKRGRASVGKKAAAEMNGEDHDDDEEEMRASPSKKSKTNGKTNGVVKVEKEAEESDDGDLV